MTAAWRVVGSFLLLLLFFYEGVRRRRRRRGGGGEGTEAEKRKVRNLPISASLFRFSPHLSLVLIAHRVRGILVVLGRAPEAEEGLGRGGGHERRGEGRGDGGAGGERRAASRRLGLWVLNRLERGCFFRGFRCVRLGRRPE